MQLQRVLEQRSGFTGCDINAFGSSETGRTHTVDTRAVEEAIVVALDIFQSMDEDFDPEEESEDKTDVTPDERAEEALLAQFHARCVRVADATATAKQFLASLDSLPSIRRYITYDEDANRVWFTLNRRRRRAENALAQLRMLFTRLHWQNSQGRGSRRDTRLADWEDFVAVAASGELQHLVDHLLELVQADRNLATSNGTPHRFLDPLSGEIFHSPVKANDGFTYERARIQAWCETFGTSPLNPTVMLRSDMPLVPDQGLEREIQSYLSGLTRGSFYPPRPLVARVGNYTYVALPKTTSIMSILFDMWAFRNVSPSDTRLWHGLVDCGDNRYRGDALQADRLLCGLCGPNDVTISSRRGQSYSLSSVKLEMRRWYYMPTAMERLRTSSKTMSRLDVVKQAFESFVDKLEAFDHPIAVGLVTFGRQVTQVQDVTVLKEQFRESMKNIKADGDTPLYDSIGIAHSMLTNFRNEHPHAALRIICLTDGQDVGSALGAHTVAKRLQKSRVLLDSMVVHSEHESHMLHSIAVATGGYSFIVEKLETMLRSRDRVERPPKPLVRTVTSLNRYSDVQKFPLDVITSDNCPPRKPHARLDGKFRCAESAASRPSNSAASTRQRRLMQELRDIVNSPHPAVDVYTDDDLAFWKIVIEAPQGSPYEGGTFLAYIDFGEEYPQVAPEVRFVTPILHPNINRHGRVCHAALDRSWLVDMTMTIILQIVYGLLLTPDTDNLLDLHATMEYNDDGGRHAFKAHEMVQKHALKSRVQWRE
ncbi:hypothetical protein CERSUDRAFT_118447, partial [Gelatoporia subvermispora B]